jgi:hypothetical protein
MSNDTYILQKDWVSPFFNYSKGTEWVRADGTGYYKPSTGREILTYETDIASMPEWFKKKETKERVEVSRLIAHPVTEFSAKYETVNAGKSKQYKNAYEFYTSHPINNDQSDLIKQAIEKVLNEEEKPVIDKATKEKYFKQVLECLKHNKVMVDTREDGIYIRLAGSESKGQAFTLHFANAFPYPELQYQQSSETLSDTVLEKERIPEAKVLSNIDAYQMGLKDGLNFASKYI